QLMDPLGLLYAAIGMLVYPGGVYLTGMAGMCAWTAGLPRGPASIRAEAWAAIIAAALAAVLAPMARSLVAALPPDRGVAPNLVAAPLVTQPFDAGVAVGPRAVTLGALMLMALSIALAGTVTSGSAPLEALVVIAAGAVYALLLRLLQRAVVVEHAALLVS